MAKKTVNHKLLALEDDLKAAIELEDDDRIKAGMLNILRAFSHLKDSIATSENVASRRKHGDR